MYVAVHYLRNQPFIIRSSRSQEKRDENYIGPSDHISTSVMKSSYYSYLGLKITAKKPLERIYIDLSY